MLTLAGTHRAATLHTATLATDTAGLLYIFICYIVKLYVYIHNISADIWRYFSLFVVIVMTNRGDTYILPNS